MGLKITDNKWKSLDSVETDKVSLEIFECECGFHLGLDSSFIIEVENIEIECPSCSAKLNTEDFEE